MWSCRKFGQCHQDPMKHLTSYTQCMLLIFVEKLVNNMLRCRCGHGRFIFSWKVMMFVWVPTKVAAGSLVRTVWCHYYRRSHNNLPVNLLDEIKRRKVSTALALIRWHTDEYLSHSRADICYKIFHSFSRIDRFNVPPTSYYVPPE